jgi:peptidoglycan/LPS O-acetylase OafA/YrhL
MSSDTASTRRFAQLDGLRAIAICVVMLHHYLRRPFVFAGFGVTLFFVLSAYFATKSLLRFRTEIENGRSEFFVALKSFYLNRALRLFPLYYLLIFGTALLNVGYSRSSFWSNATFLANFHILFTGHWDGRFSPLWSLSVLEQFYFVWPFLILCVSGRKLVPVVLAVILLAPLYRLVCLRLYLPPLYWCVVPFASFDQLGCGALLALCERGFVSCEVRDGIHRVATRICAPLFFALLFWNAPGHAIYVNLVASLAFIGCVDSAARGFKGRVGKVLENPVLGHVGRISYSIFLLHDFTDLLFPKVGFLKVWLASEWRVLLLIPTTICLAHFSWWLIEEPIRQFRQKRSTSKPERAVIVPPPISSPALARRDEKNGTVNLALVGEQ